MGASSWNIQDEIIVGEEVKELSGHVIGRTIHMYVEFTKNVMGVASERGIVNQEIKTSRNGGQWVMATRQKVGGKI